MDSKRTEDWVRSISGFETQISRCKSLQRLTHIQWSCWTTSLDTLALIFCFGPKRLLHQKREDGVIVFWWTTATATWLFHILKTDSKLWSKSSFMWARQGPLHCKMKGGFQLSLTERTESLFTCQLLEIRREMVVSGLENCMTTLHRKHELREEREEQSFGGGGEQTIPNWK